MNGTWTNKITSRLVASGRSKHRGMNREGGGQKQSTFTYTHFIKQNKKTKQTYIFLCKYCNSEWQYTGVEHGLEGPQCSPSQSKPVVLVVLYSHHTAWDNAAKGNKQTNERTEEEKQKLTKRKKETSHNMEGTVRKRNAADQHQSNKQRETVRLNSENKQTDKRSFIYHTHTHTHTFINWPMRGVVIPTRSYLNAFSRPRRSTTNIFVHL